MSAPRGPSAAHRSVVVTCTGKAIKGMPRSSVVICDKVGPVFR